jgi:hypothetical protein
VLFFGEKQAKLSKKAVQSQYIVEKSKKNVDKY